jgi:protein-S-isoprenylcysteine O-methyltransferase Ste14
MSIATALTGMWALWFASWILAAFWRDRATKRPPVASEVIYRVLVSSGGALMFGVFGRTLLGRSVWELSLATDWACVAVVPVGLAFTWWARLHLGRLWSSSVTRKADHRIIDTGPYGIVRHPIYTGVIFSVLLTAAVRGTIGGLVGAALIIWGFYVKARLEESFLQAELGGVGYEAYRRRVPMLVPFMRSW